jgi:hypothetical protein
MSAVPSKSCGQAAVTMVAHEGLPACASFHAANVDPLASADAAGSFLLISLSTDMDLAASGGLAGTLLQRGGCWGHASFRDRITPTSALYLS